VVQGGEQVSLSFQAGQALRITVQILGQHLDGNIALQSGVGATGMIGAHHLLYSHFVWHLFVLAGAA